MANIVNLFFILIIITCFSIKTKAQNIYSSDVDNFWKAYDKIIKTKDSDLQKKILEDLYFSKATEGVKAIREARNYTSQDYIDAINNYPKFWSSVRENTLKSKSYQKDLNLGIKKLRKIYPELKSAKIYFTIGALRTNGTIKDNLILIGSELAMTDKNTVTDEFPENIRKARRLFFDTEPIKNLVLLNIHEYVHTQQKAVGDNLLSSVIYEGIAEYVSTKAMNLPSAAPAIEYGKNNAAKVRAKFEEEMFYINNFYKWLWGDSPNDFGVRDLGYYIGYQMAENFYNQAENKNEAIKKMIELDYSQESEIEYFVKTSNFFSKPLDDLYKDFENKRPTVIGIKQFKNNDKNISPKINEITVEFSESLNGSSTSIDFGDLGKSAFPKNDATKRYWSKDLKSWTITVTLEPNKKYQLLIGNNFKTNKNIPLKPYLIEFETGN